jgi:diguanylate cyclase (GGDEF)-like protein
MPAATPSADEDKRLLAVNATRLLGTPAEERFDKITRLARRMFDVPFAIIDLVGAEVTWLKSAQGFDGVDAPRECSYCHHTVMQEGVCVIDDARVDARVYDNPNAPTFVFYAGVPLKFDGRNVGVLCISDTKPRVLTEEDLTALRDLAALAEQELQVVALSAAQLTLAASNRELEMKSLVDVLTRLWNRRAIQEIAARALEQAGGHDGRTGFAILDIDHFKKINDTYGHAAGDEVLRVISERLRAAIRKTDAVGRYGGEEFLVVLPGIAESSMIEACERIRRAISKQPVPFEGIDITVTCSVGCALAENDDAAVDDVVRSADAALYAAKRAGRDRVEHAWRSDRAA